MTRPEEIRLRPARLLTTRRCAVKGCTDLAARNLDCCADCAGEITALAELARLKDGRREQRRPRLWFRAAAARVARRLRILNVLFVLAALAFFAVAQGAAFFGWN